MTSEPFVFSQKTILFPNPKIYTADGSHMFVSHNGIISTSFLNIGNRYLVPKLSLNLISVSQLYELGLEVKFSNKGYDV